MSNKAQTATVITDRIEARPRALLARCFAAAPCVVVSQSGAIVRLSESQLYGPIGKAGWDVIESEIDRQCETAGLTFAQQVGAGFSLNLETGEMKLESYCGLDGKMIYPQRVSNK